MLITRLVTNGGYPPTYRFAHNFITHPVVPSSMSDSDIVEGSERDKLRSQNRKIINELKQIENEDCIARASYMEEYDFNGKWLRAEQEYLKEKANDLQDIIDGNYKKDD